MIIRHTNKSDFKRVMEIYAIAREKMAENGNPNQWGATNWPPSDLIMEDIEQQKGYLCESNGRIVGVFFYDYGQDIEPTYQIIHNGEWAKNEPYGVVHRIASDGSIPGIGTFCLNWAFEQCHNLRIDTHPDNKIMQNLLAKLGFKKRGIIYIPVDNDPRYAYEKINDISI